MGNDAAVRASECFQERHRWPDGNTAHGKGTSFWEYHQAQEMITSDVFGGPVSAGPGNRDATRDEARRHLAWLHNMAFLRKLADYRASESS